MLKDGRFKVKFRVRCTLCKEPMKKGSYAKFDGDGQIKHADKCPILIQKTVNKIDCDYCWSLKEPEKCTLSKMIELSEKHNCGDHIFDNLKLCIVLNNRNR